MPTTRSVPVLRGTATEPELDLVAVEEPLEIRAEGKPVAITMRTPGHDLDLAAGFLFTEGVIDGPDDLVALAIVGENTVDARLAEGVPAARARSADRAFFASSSCGICGKASIDRLFRDVPRVSGWAPAPDVLAALPDRLHAAQDAFRGSGGVHAAALFDVSGMVFDLREDVGRHNAVDKVLGARLRADTLDFATLGMVVTSRAGFEVVQKALAAGVPTLVAMGAPTSLAVEAAREGGMTLIGWLRPDRWVTYVSP